VTNMMRKIARPPLSPGIRLQENVYFTMRDGIKIATDVYLPEAEGKYPAILSLAPYRKESAAGSPLKGYHTEGGNPHYFVPKGYVMVVATCRGAGMSQGQYNYRDIKEQQDGHDLVEAIAKQPWCTGKVGMLGGSYLGISQYFTAEQRPPHLACICPCDAQTDSYRDGSYQHGGMYKGPGFSNNWGVNTIGDCFYPGPVEGKLPPMNLIQEWLTHFLDGPWHWERSAITNIEKIECPVLCIASASAWLHTRGQLIGYTRMKSTKKLVVGPRIYGNMFSTLYWENERTNKYILRWLDYWLKGIDTGIMKEPQVILYDDGTDEWRYENEYPLARTKWTKFYLHTNPSKPGQVPQGLISMEAPSTDELPDTYQAPRKRPDIISGKVPLAYVTEPLTQAVKLAGPLSATLYGSSSTVETAPLAWFVKIGDVAPDGSVKIITEGNLKAAFREVDESKSKPGQPWHLFQKQVYVDPGKIYDYQIEIQPIFHTFKPGHKIWFQIASDDAAFVLNNYEDPVMGPVPAENSVYHDEAHPSYILLPVIPDAPIITPVKEPLF
jgi:predicted acyl esterase